MKDRRFIELLNLYVDREISPAEAAELESEVLQSPERRKVYEQYCRMDRACTLLLAGAAAHAPAPRMAEALANADRKVEEFPVRTPDRTKLVFFSGLMAAAAAIAVVFVNRDTAPGLPSTPNAAEVLASLPEAAPAAGVATTGREATVALPFGRNANTIAADVPASQAWLHEGISRSAPLSENDLMLVRRTDRTFSEGPTWVLHREGAGFPRGGLTRPPEELSAFELSK